LIEQWIDEIKKSSDPDVLGMILSHTGVVRGTGKDGKPVEAMKLSCDRIMLAQALDVFKAKEGIVEIKVWLNEGDLAIGDEIMNVCVAGRFRTDVLPVFEELLTLLKTRILQEKEL
jgi:molybdopterin synthase catalytic subunit